jgi:putative NIF3 family GTP cyclohydrolase 1 type 2
VVFAGHYATETVGVKALAKVLEKKFRVKTVFLDLPTGT